MSERSMKEENEEISKGSERREGDEKLADFTVLEI